MDRDGSSIRVLHVDDDPATLDLTRSFLEHERPELTVESVERVDAALDRLHEEPSIDCVLSDYEMCETDGLAFLATVRELRPAVPFLLYSSVASDEIAAEAIEGGVSDYVRKDAGAAHFLQLGTRIKREVERTRVESANETHLAALEATREGVCVVDANGNVKYANRAYLDLYGYEREELLGTSWDRLSPDSEAEFVTRDVLPYVEEHGEWSGDGVGRRHDGTTFRESKSIEALPDGELVIAVTAFEAVSESFGTDSVPSDA